MSSTTQSLAWVASRTAIDAVLDLTSLDHKVCLRVDPVIEWMLKLGRQLVIRVYMQKQKQVLIKVPICNNRSRREEGLILLLAPSHNPSTIASL